MNAVSASLAHSTFLRRVLLVDAATCVAMGLLLSPSALGYIFVIGQAAVVALLAELEHVGLRRARN